MEEVKLRTNLNAIKLAATASTMKATKKIFVRVS